MCVSRSWLLTPKQCVACVSRGVITNRNRWLANQYFHSQHSKTSEPSPATRLMSLFACQIQRWVVSNDRSKCEERAQQKVYEITCLMSDTLQWYCFSYLHHLILVHFCPIFLQQAHKLKYVTGEERQEVSSKTEPEIVTGLWAIEHAEVRDVPLHR